MQIEFIAMFVNYRVEVSSLVALAEVVRYAPKNWTTVWVAADLDDGFISRELQEVHFLVMQQKILRG